MTKLIHELIFKSADRNCNKEALVYKKRRINYTDLADEVGKAATGLLGFGLVRHERVAVYLEKRIETVVSLFATTLAGGVFVPINELLKPEQVAYILADCNVRILVTSVARLKLLEIVLPQCRDLHTIVVVGVTGNAPHIPDLNIVSWEEICLTTNNRVVHRCVDSDMAAILYTSGSTGKPKGVVLSHRNLVIGAKSVATYLENNPDDRILSVLPLSFDYGFSQLTTAFYVGATNVLMNYLFPRDIVNTIVEENISALAAVPPLWIQLSQLNNLNKANSLRYITSSGGVMPRQTLHLIRRALPKTKVFLMYGLTEAFRSTYLPSEEVDKRPDSIGKAIPNAKVFVLREDGTHCAPEEPGELVHCGPLVSLGYWNDTQKTAACFKPLVSNQIGLSMQELAVWSGDTVRVDKGGYFYFISRRDEMIKTSGYRVSPTEVEDVIYATEQVGEAVAIGVPHPNLGQAIVVVVTSRAGVTLDADKLLMACKRHLPAFMLPSLIDIRTNELPRNANGKIDRKCLAHELQQTFINISV